jgi:hypothetical protein
LDPIFIAIPIVAVLVLGLLWWRTRGARGEALPARNPAVAGFVDTVAGWTPKSTRVLSNTERQAFETLRSAFPAHVILAQVPLARFIKVPTRNSYSEWLRRAGQLCADFVVCDRYTQVIAVVEVRPASESQKEERASRRQRRLERVLKAAEIPVHVWAEHALPSVEAARDTILPTPPEAAVAAVQAPVVVNAAPAPAPAVNPLMDADRDITDDEVIEMREPPPSTWFDDLDTAPAPLEPPRRSGPTTR